MNERLPEINTVLGPQDAFESEGEESEKESAIKKSVMEKSLSAWDIRAMLPPSKEIRLAKLERRATDHLFDKEGNPRKMRELPDHSVALLSNKEFMDEIENREEELPSTPTEENGYLDRLKQEAMTPDFSKLPHSDGF